MAAGKLYQPSIGTGTESDELGAVDRPLQHWQATLEQSGKASEEWISNTATKLQKLRCGSAGPDWRQLQDGIRQPE